MFPSKSIWRTQGHWILVLSTTYMSYFWPFFLHFMILVVPDHQYLGCYQHHKVQKKLPKIWHICRRKYQYSVSLCPSDELGWEHHFWLRGPIYDNEPWWPSILRLSNNLYLILIYICINFMCLVLMFNDDRDKQIFCDIGILTIDYDCALHIDNDSIANLDAYFR